jgi:hypothetical protein
MAENMSAYFATRSTDLVEGAFLVEAIPIFRYYWKYRFIARLDFRIIVHVLNNELRAELISMREEDLRVRQELLDAGQLGGSYVPRMEAVHVKNAARLRQRIAQYGWPGEDIAGKDGAEAAWMVAQHAIGEPELQREVLQLLQECASAGRAPAWHAAYLEDRIAMYEGRPQRFGSQWVDDPRDGRIRPWKLLDPERVYGLRASVGLGPLSPIPDQGPDLPDDQRRAIEENARWWREWLASKGWQK